MTTAIKKIKVEKVTCIQWTGDIQAVMMEFIKAGITVAIYEMSDDRYMLGGYAGLIIGFLNSQVEEGKGPYIVLNETTRTVTIEEDLSAYQDDPKTLLKDMIKDATEEASKSGDSYELGYLGGLESLLSRLVGGEEDD